MVMVYQSLSSPPEFLINAEKTKNIAKNYINIINTQVSS